MPLSGKVQSLDLEEDEMILASQNNGIIATVDFNGKMLFDTKIKGNAKYMIGNCEKMFVTGSRSGLVDLKTGKFEYIVDCHDYVTSFSF